MPGIGLDPMAMQNMIMSGGFGGGMNGVGMGMGFDGGVGQGFSSGWHGQQSWNVGDSYNHPNALAMGHGDYGANNSGYPSQAPGFDQGNFAGANKYNNYQNNFGNFRGRGRGRGGYSRGGGYGHGSNDTFSQQLPQQFGSSHQQNGPVSESGLAPTGPKAEAGNVDEFGREIRQKSTTAENATKPEDGNIEKKPDVTTEVGLGPEVVSEVIPVEKS